MQYFEPSKIPPNFTNEYFTKCSASEKELMNEVKTYGFHFMFPLLMDIASMDMYLLDNVSMRIRHEFATDKFVVNATPDTNP